MGDKCMKSTLLFIAGTLLFVSIGSHAAEWNINTKTNCKIWDDDYMPNRVISWSGGCVDGYASGSGTIVWYRDGKETEQYKGEMKKGKYDGKGTFTWSNGDKYEGDFVDGKYHGKGVLTSIYGSKYIGDFLDGKPHGKGTYTFKDGNTYIGDFMNGMFHGKGTRTFKNGSYTGDFKFEAQNGNGTYTWSNGDKYEGDLVNEQVRESLHLQMETNT